MNYNNYLKNLFKKFEILDLIDSIQELNGTKEHISYVQLEDNDIEVWLEKVGLLKSDKNGCYKTDLLDTHYKEILEDLVDFSWNQLDASKVIPIYLLENNPSEISIDIKELLLKNINPKDLLNELYDLEDTSEFKCVIDIEYNSLNWLIENRLVDNSIKGSYYCINHDLRESLINQLTGLFESEYILYKINFTHFSKKDSESGLKKMLISKSEDEVFKHICQNHSEFINNAWRDYEEHELKLIKENKGDMFKTDNHSYYGTTRWQWEEVSKVRYDEIIVLLKLKIAELL